MLICAGIALSIMTRRRAQEPTLELKSKKIPLGPVKGRLDHLAVDPRTCNSTWPAQTKSHFLVSDLKTQTVTNTIGGLSEPQGVGFSPAQNAVLVANGGDGSVVVFRRG